MLISSQPVFALTPLFCVLSEETANTNFIVFGLTLDPTTNPWSTAIMVSIDQCSNPWSTAIKVSIDHYTTDANEKYLNRYRYIYFWNLKYMHGVERSHRSCSCSSLSTNKILTITLYHPQMLKYVLQRHPFWIFDQHKNIHLSRGTLQPSSLSNGFVVR